MNKLVALGLVVTGSGLVAASSGCSAERLGEKTARSEHAVGECTPQPAGGTDIANLKPFQNTVGHHATYSTRDGDNLDTANPFFSTALGTNGRSCASCHAVEDGMSISTGNINRRFDASCGTDALFKHDGMNTEGVDPTNMTLEEKRNAMSLLLTKGLIRLRIKPPATAQFTLVGVSDPYNNPDNDLAHGIIVYRRPLAATNLKFLNAVMWDTREGGGEASIINQNLKNQARGAIIGHAQGTDPGDAVLQQIVDFQSALFTSQTVVQRAGSTDNTDKDVYGGPVNLSSQAFAVNENRVLPIPAPPASPFGVLTTRVFTVFDGWSNSPVDLRASIARGQQIFNERVITDPGLNPPGTRAPFTCSTCHNSFNSGGFSHSLSGRPFGGSPTVGVSDVQFNTDLPVYTFKETISPYRTLVTTDPGQALKTGLTRDWQRFKSPNLRGLSSRAPYFHNGKAATLGDVVDHYDVVFNPPGTTPPFTAQEKEDLVNFMSAL